MNANLFSKPYPSLEKSTERTTATSKLLTGKRSFEETIEDSPRTLTKRSNVANELFPIDDPEENRRPKKSRQATSSPPKSKQSPPSESVSPPSAPPASANTSQLAPPQPHGHYPAPPPPWPLGQLAAAPSHHHPEGMPHGAQGPLPSAHGYHSGYGQYYPPMHPNQRNTDIHRSNSPTQGLNVPHQHGFGGDYPGWGMPTAQYPYPERRPDFPNNQYPYPEPRAGPSNQMPYGHAAGGSYGPYHESNAAAYHHNPYGYSIGARQGQPPPNTHATPDVGLGANVPAPGVVRNPTLGGRHAQESRMGDGPVKEG